MASSHPSNVPVVLELAFLPREQVGPFLLLGVDKTQGKDQIEANWAQLALVVSTLGWIGSLWFFVAFGYLLRRVEGDPPWRSTIATLSGALLAAYGLVGVSLGAASLHGGKITPDVADFAWAFANVGFANAWIAVASFALCSGWVILSTRALERWMGWWLIVAGLGLVAARFVWTSELWTLPYLLLWAWVLVLSVRLIATVLGRTAGDGLC